MDRHNIPGNQKNDKVESSQKFLPETLQDAVRRTLEESSTPAKQLSRHLGISYQLLLNASNRNLPFKFSSRHILPLMLLTGNYSILHYLVHKTGHYVFKLPRPNTNISKNELSIFFETEGRWKSLTDILNCYFAGHNNKNPELLEKVDEGIWGLINSLAKLKAVMGNNKNGASRKEDTKW